MKSRDTTLLSIMSPHNPDLTVLNSCQFATYKSDLKLVFCFSFIGQLKDGDKKNNFTNMLKMNINKNKKDKF